MTNISQKNVPGLQSFVLILVGKDVKGEEKTVICVATFTATLTHPLPQYPRQFFTIIFPTNT